MKQNWKKSSHLKTEEIDPDAEISVHATMEKAIDNYRRIKEVNKELTEKRTRGIRKRMRSN